VRVWFAALLVLVVMIVAMHDVANEPRYSWSGRAAIGTIDSYRAHVSPHLRVYVRCRFTPTCSAYGREAIRKYGFAAGSWRAVKRIARCGPWTPFGTVDPP